MARNVKVAILGDSRSFDAAFSKAETTLSKFGRSVGQTVAAVGVAATAIGVGMATSLAKVGIEYNTLEQRSRAAFKSIMGDAELATKMMDDLMAFAKQSPFPRQAFIQATQQMLSFGIEAGKVIPYLSAIQDATAAIGGTDVELLELANIFSKIQSTSKITAENLNEFGYRGVNAAEVIGAMMGKTAAQIRDDITAGALDAGTALDALAFGITLKFGGAAEGLKGTWIGAVDRVKGAWRDLGSALVEPFISKEGGGKAVEWANQLADLLRRIEAEVVPKLGASMQRLADRVTPAVDKMFAAFSPENIDKTVALFRELAPLVNTVAAGFGLMALRALPIVGGLFAAFNPFVGALVAAALSIPAVRDGILAIGRAFLDGGLSGAWSEFTNQMSGAVEAAQREIPKLLAAFVNWADNIWNGANGEEGLAAKLDRTWDNLPGWVDTKVEELKVWVTDFIAGFNDWSEGIWNGKNGQPGLKHHLEAAMAKFQAWVADDGATIMWLQGAQLSWSLFKGLLTAIALMSAAAAQITWSLAKAFIDLLPAINRVFIEFGKSIGRFILQGIKEVITSSEYWQFIQNPGLSIGQYARGLLPFGDVGGIVPGPYPGAPVPMIVHAGETITSKRNAGFADTGDNTSRPQEVWIHNVFNLDGRKVAESFRKAELVLR